MEPHGQVNTVEDITVRKSAEGVLRAAEEALSEEKEYAQVTLNSIGDAVVTTDLLGNVSYLNRVAETMTSWSREDALGRPLAEVVKLIDGTTRQAAVNPAQRAMNENRTVGLVADCVLVRRDGSESVIEDSAAPIHNRDGRVVGIPAALPAEDRPGLRDDARCRAAHPLVESRSRTRLPGPVRSSRRTVRPHRADRPPVAA